MTIASRTPEGVPHHCPVCGKFAMLEPSDPGGDACCPNCGHLLWWFRDRLHLATGVGPEQVALSSSFIDDLDIDSLDLAELIMEAEESFGVVLSDAAAEELKTVQDAIRFLQQHRLEMDEEAS